MGRSERSHTLVSLPLPLTLNCETSQSPLRRSLAGVDRGQFLKRVGARRGV